MTTPPPLPVQQPVQYVQPQIQYVQPVYEEPQEVTYFTRPMSFFKRILTGNVVSKSKQMEYITFRTEDFDIKTRGGRLYNFKYNDVDVTDTYFGRIATITPKIKSRSTGVKLKLHVVLDNDELTDQEGEYILNTLNAGRRVFL